MSKRFFINNLDTYLGQAIYHQLYKPEEENDDLVIIGTYTDPLNKEKIPGVKKILNRQKPKLFRKYLVESDVCIYDLHFGDIKEVEFAVNAFKAKQPFDDPKTLILVSSVLVWDGTPKKIKPPEEVTKEDGDLSQLNNTQESERKPAEEVKEEEKEDEDEDEDEDEEKEPVEGEETGENGEPKEGIIEEKPPQEEEEAPPEYLPFKEEDYPLRAPTKDKYKEMKELEDLVLSLQIENVRVYVVCAGIFYGLGELAFKNVLKAAWLQKPKELPYIGEGQNLVPTIHINDLAKLVLKIADNTPENNPYIFAIDNTKDRRQINIMESISRLVGTGNIEPIPEADNKIILKEFEDMFTCDLWLIPSPQLVPPTEDDTVDFEWTAEKGIPETMNVILKEFCERESSN